MLSFLPGPVRGLLTLLLFFINTLFWVIPIFVITLLKALVPLKGWRFTCSNWLNAFVAGWVGVNSRIERLFSRVKWHVQGLDNLALQEWYIVVANHQSWVDILVLQRIFHRKIPMLKFFLKQELFWFPILGIAWWALDFPFMKRYKPSVIKKKPHLKGKDLEITRKACQKFKTMPVTVMNFVEGTRFTPEKHRRQRSPYRHLLRAKSGGLAFALATMGGQFKSILDVTIAYPVKNKSFWDYACGKIPEIRVHVKHRQIDGQLRGDYFGDRSFRKKFQAWLNELWLQKDQRVEALLGRQGADKPDPIP